MGNMLPKIPIGRPCKEIQDRLGFWFPRRGFRIPGTRFQTPILNGIPDSLSCIPDSKTKDS